MLFFARVQEDRRREILGVVVLSATALLFLSLLTDDFQQAAGRPLTNVGDVPNLLGVPGAITAGVLYLFLGHGAHALYFLTGIWGAMLLSHKAVDRFPLRAAGMVFVAGAISGLLDLHLSSQPDLYPGGMLGAFVSYLILPRFGLVGASVIAVTLAIIGLLLSTEFLIARCAIFLFTTLNLILRATAEVVRGIVGLIQHSHAHRTDREPSPLSEKTKTSRHKSVANNKNKEERRTLRSVLSSLYPRRDDLSRIKVRPEDAGKKTKTFIEKSESPSETRRSIKEIPTKEQPADAEQLELAEATTGLTQSEAKAKKSSLRRRKKRVEFFDIPPDYKYPKHYTAPSLSILMRPEKRVMGEVGEALRQTGVLLEDTLETFGIEARVTDVTRGPTITRYEVEPAPGVKVNRFMALADDLALALKAHRVRVEAPIPGKGRVGIELPNAEREAVVVRELLEDRSYRKSGGVLPLTLGKDISGEVVVADLATMPHLLVAGATGAGKTIFVKTLLTGLLFKHSPEELQLMMIDPKMVELSIFNDIPHLITPVVIDPKKAAASLNWLIGEMEERYRLFAHLGVRNIEVYNGSVENGEIEFDSATGDGESVSIIRKLPYIVCIIDELADLMMLARADVEDSIGRLAQLARAVGIHLIIATQRPSVDVLTGVIKANFPARVSFQVSSRVDSRCILDEIGAERLIGRGDMLYLPPGQAKPLRIQGAFVSDEEVASLISYLKTQAPPQYRDEIENFGKNKDTIEDLANETDELFDDAVRIVMETGQASISMVQRRLRVGYTRAARLIDMMEVKGIVGPHTGSKARDILVDTPHKNEVA